MGRKWRENRRPGGCRPDFGVVSVWGCQRRGRQPAGFPGAHFRPGVDFGVGNAVARLRRPLFLLRPLRRAGMECVGLVLVAVGQPQLVGAGLGCLGRARLSAGLSRQCGTSHGPYPGVWLGLWARDGSRVALLESVKPGGIPWLDTGPALDAFVTSAPAGARPPGPNIHLSGTLKMGGPLVRPKYLWIAHGGGNRIGRGPARPGTGVQG